MQDVGALADQPEILWLNQSSTFRGMNDRVAVEHTDQLASSLFLLHLKEVELRVFAPGRDFGNPTRRVQACFSHRGVRYCLQVTDPVVERKYLAGKDGEFSVGEAFATVSLGEPFEGYCYKLVAAIIDPKGQPE